MDILDSHGDYSAFALVATHARSQKFLSTALITLQIWFLSTSIYSLNYTQSLLFL